MLPKDNKEKKVFWEYRIGEIWNAYKMIIIYMCIQLVFYFINFAAIRDRKSMWTFLIMVASVCEYILGWFIGQRFKKQFIYFVPVLYIIL